MRGKHAYCCPAMRYTLTSLKSTRCDLCDRNVNGDVPVVGGRTLLEADDAAGRPPPPLAAVPPLLILVIYMMCAIKTSNQTTSKQGQTTNEQGRE